MKNKKFNKSKFHYRTVALILAAIILVGFSHFNIANAFNSDSFNCSLYPNPVDTTTPITNLINTAVNMGCKAQLEKRDLTADELTQIKILNNQAKTINNTPTIIDTALAPITSIVNALTPTPSSTTMTLISGLGNYAAGAAAFAIMVPWLTFLAAINVILAALVTISGIIFDQAMTLSIFNMKDFFSGGGVVNVLWVMIRDMLNICFIFILLYIAITKIIGTWGVSAKTTLTNIIISAIFINFSMFIAKILIDAGNMVAVQFYNLISPEGIGFQISASIFKGSTVMDTLTSITTLSGQTNILISLVLQIICLAILIWVFLYFSMIIIGRTVMLVFLTMTSPIGFISHSIPWLGSFSKKWWESFIDQILVAPLMMFFLYFVTKLIETKTISNILLSSKAQASLLSTPPLDPSGMLVYILIVVILLKGLKIIKEKSGEVGQMAVKIAGTAAVAGAAIVTGGAALGLGAMSSGAGAAAQLAGKKGISSIGSRLAFSAKNIGESKIGKFVKGEHEKTGVSGLAQGFAREKVIGGVGGITGGTVNIKGIEKMLKESTKKAEENVSKKAEALGPQKALDRQKQLSDIRANITAQAEMKLPEDIRKQKPEGEKDIGKANKDLAEKTKTRDESDVKLKKAEEKAKESGDFKASEEARTAFNKAVNDLSVADTKVKTYQDYAAKLRVEEEKVAKEMGIAETKFIDDSGKEQLSALKTIEEEEKGLVGKIREGIAARNKYINEEIAGGSKLSTMLWAGDRKKLVEKLRAQKGKYSSAEENFLKKVKDFVKKEEGGGGEKEEKKEEKPKTA